MAYVKGKGYVKTGYTACQKEIAEWINLKHTHMRDDPTLRCYACNESGHHYWPYVKYPDLNPNGEDDLGGGVALLKGTFVPGASYTTSRGQVIEGRVQNFTAKPSPICSFVVVVMGRGATGKQVLHNRIFAGRRG